MRSSNLRPGGRGAVNPVKMKGGDKMRATVDEIKRAERFNRIRKERLDKERTCGCGSVAYSKLTSKGPWVCKACLEEFWVEKRA